MLTHVCQVLFVGGGFFEFIGIVGGFMTKIPPNTTQGEFNKFAFGFLILGQALVITSIGLKYLFG